MGESPKQGAILMRNYTKKGKGGYGLPLVLVGGLNFTTEFQMMVQVETCPKEHVQFHLLDSSWLFY